MILIILWNKLTLFTFFLDTSLAYFIKIYLQLIAANLMILFYYVS